MYVLLFLAAAVTDPVIGTPAQDSARFDAAMRDRHFDEAGRSLDLLIEQRTPPSGKPIVDHLIAARAGRLAVGHDHFDVADAYLATLDLDQIPPAERLPALLAHAEALEQLGYRPAALKRYREAAAIASENSRPRMRALLGLARVTLPENPAAAGALIESFADTADWEVQWLRAASASLAGEPGKAQQLSLRAWAQAATAPSDQLAPLRTAVLRAGLAAAAGDRAGQLSMLAAANAPAAQVSTWAMAQLPVCGDDGLRPSDWLTIGVAAGPYGQETLLPIAASRPAAIAPLFDALLGRALLENDSLGPKGTVVTIACAASANSGYVARSSLRDPLGSWMAEKGLYWLNLPDLDPAEQVTERSRRIKALEARFGPATLLTLPPRMQMLTGLEQLYWAGGNVSLGRIAELSGSIAATLRASDAPAGMAESFELRPQFHQLRRDWIQGNWTAAAGEEAGRKLVSVLPFDLAARTAREEFSTWTGELAPLRARLLTILARRTPPNMELRARQAWLLHVAAAQSAAGMQQEARMTLAQAGLPEQLCASADREPKVIESNFASDDFPRDLVFAAQPGRTALELSVTKDGKVGEHRIVLAAPSSLFDAVARSNLSGMTLSPAERAGRPVACTGVLQSVKWHLPPPNESEMPTLAPTEPQETS